MALPISVRLAIRTWAARPLRPVLCSIAIGVAVALIICIGVAMDSLASSLSNAIGQALGVAEVHVRPVAEAGMDAKLPGTMLEKVRSFPETDFADGRLWGKASITHGTSDARLFDVVGLDTAMDEKLRPKIFKEGRPLSEDPAKAATEIVVDSTIQDVAELNLKLGEKIRFAADEDHPHELTVVGVVKRPGLELIATPTLYVAYGVLEKDLKAAGQFRVLDIKLKASSGITDFDKYAKDLQAKLETTFGKTIEVMPGTTNKAKLGDLTENMRIMLLVLSTLAAMCAALIIGTTLSVGVQERVRQFGQLRCIGASRWQLAIFLLGDAGVMLAIGEVLGLALGLGLSFWIIKSFPKFFSEYNASFWSLFMAALCGMLATLLGAAIPIWQVTRVSPMAAVTASAKGTARKWLWVAAFVGCFCIITQIVLWNLPVSRDFRFYSYVFPGIPLIFAGWTLLAPAILLLIEKNAAAALGNILGVRPTLLRSAWSRTPWRAGAMIAALMVGVTLFTTVRARGQSLLVSWTIPTRIPDIMGKRFGGITAERIAELKVKHPEITDITPFEPFPVHMQDKVFRLGNLFSGGGTTFIMADAETFSRMVDLEYLQGDPKTALAQMKEGHHLIVPKEFYNVKHLGVGDKLTLRGADGNPVEFTIAAVVNSTGVDLIQNFFDLRQNFTEQASSSIMGTISDGMKIFNKGEPTMMIVDFDHTKQPNPTKLTEALKGEGYMCFSSAELKSSLTSLLRRIIDGLSVIGIGALCVASLGVANMVIASIHARRFEFGVLRAIGAGRFQLVRLVLAEVTLIGLVAGTLGAAAGLHYAYMGGQMEFLLLGYPNHFLSPDLGPRVLMIIGSVALAIVLTTLLAWLASLGPAIRGALGAQRAVLASGRS